MAMAMMMVMVMMVMVMMTMIPKAKRSISDINCEFIHTLTPESQTPRVRARMGCQVTAVCNHAQEKEKQRFCCRCKFTIKKGLAHQNPKPITRTRSSLRRTCSSS